jgi:hypothetical protein
MATLNEFAYNIRNIGRAGQSDADDERLKIDMIKFWIKGYRAKLIHDLTFAGKMIDPQLIQDLGVVPVTEVDKADSDCPECIEWGCNVLKVEIPKLVDLPNNRGLIFIGLIDKQTPIVLDYPDTSFYKRQTRFGNKFHRAYLINNKLYIITKQSNSELKYINVRGVFEDPTKAFTYTVPGCDKICYDDNIDTYPIPMRMYEPITQGILQNELNITLNSVNDELNNARQNYQPEGQ